MPVVSEQSRTSPWLRTITGWFLVPLAVVAFTACVIWVYLPVWAPVWTARHSPWADPFLRAMATDLKSVEDFDGEPTNGWFVIGGGTELQTVLYERRRAVGSIEVWLAWIAAGLESSDPRIRHLTFLEYCEDEALFGEPRRVQEMLAFLEDPHPVNRQAALAILIHVDKTHPQYPAELRRAMALAVVDMELDPSAEVQETLADWRLNIHFDDQPWPAYPSVLLAQVRQDPLVFARQAELLSYWCEDWQYWLAESSEAQLEGLVSDQEQDDWFAARVGDLYPQSGPLMELLRHAVSPAVRAEIGLMLSSLLVHERMQAVVAGGKPPDRLDLLLQIAVEQRNGRPVDPHPWLFDGLEMACQWYGHDRVRQALPQQPFCLLFNPVIVEGDHSGSREGALAPEALAELTQAYLQAHADAGHPLAAQLLTPISVRWREASAHEVVEGLRAQLPALDLVVTLDPALLDHDGVFTMQFEDQPAWVVLTYVRALSFTGWDFHRGCLLWLIDPGEERLDFKDLLPHDMPADIQARLDDQVTVQMDECTVAEVFAHLGLPYQENDGWPPPVTLRLTAVPVRVALTMLAWQMGMRLAYHGDRFHFVEE